MKKYLATLLCAVSLTALAANNQQPLTASQIEEIKARAAGISNMAQTRSAAIDEAGELKRNQTGAVQHTAPSTSSMEDKARYFNGISGVTGYENQAEPGRGKVAAVKVTGTSFADFACSLMPGSQKTILGRVLKYQGCATGANGVISSVSLSVCSVSLNGGACRPQDFSATKAFRVNVYDTLEGLTLGVGCNETTKTCRITMDDTYAVAGNGERLTAAAAEKVAASGENSAQSVITERYTSDTYAQKMSEATAIDACAGAAQQSADRNGVVATCGEDPNKVQTAQIGPTATNPTCSDTPICLRKATRSVSYGQTCVRTFPLTGYSCNFNIPKFECTVTKDVKSGKVTSSCAEEDVAGGNKFKTTEPELVCTESDKMGACLTQTWVEYYTQPSKATLDGECKTSPFPMSGSVAESCLNKGVGAGSACSADGWFQRTLPESQCIAIRTDLVGDGSTSETIEYLTEAQKAGCGVCVNTTTTDTCYARPTAAEPQDSCANIDHGVCTLTASSPQSQMDGMTLSQQDVYSCTKEEETCVEYDRSNLCTNSDMTFGTDKQARSQTTTNGSMNRAMTDAALIDAVAEGTEEDPADPFVPRIFGGTDSRCEKPVGFFGNALDNDCCRLDLDRPGGGKYGNKCSLDEAKLATARRANFTVYIGDYCSKKSGFGPFKKCSKQTQTYCSFRGLLPRIIQQQGRDQLARLATSAASGTVEKAMLNFNFYDGKGGWATPTIINGVVLTPWQYPSYCANPDKAAEVLTSDPNAKECPLALTQWMASCENPQGCGALPASPEFGSERWVLSTVNPLKNITTAVSRYAMVTGACDPASTACRYEVAAWPAGIGGRAIASKELLFPLFATQEQTAKPLSGVPQDITAMGDYIFRPVSIPGVAPTNGSLPGTVRIDYSLDGGKTFAPMEVPTKIQGTDYSVPGVTDVRITGGCDSATNLCTYTTTGTVTVTAKPWGEPKYPDCTGFTLGQLSVLDFSQMDLSEWIASITNKVQGTDTANLTKTATSRTQQMLDARQAGAATISASNPQTLRAAKITPAEEFGPFLATLRVSGNYPVYFDDPALNTDPVTHVDVDWGDCTIPESLAPANEYVNGLPSSGFIARHQYASPDDVPDACGGGKRAIEHQVKVRIYSKSGMHDLTLKVINTWNTYTGKSGYSGGEVNTTVTTTAPKK